MRFLYRILLAIDKRITKRKVLNLKKQFKYCGNNVHIADTCVILPAFDFEIGDNSSISCYTTIYAKFGVKIGKNCLISSNCGISSYNHIIDSDDRHRDEIHDHKYSKAVLIGDNVWIGMNACILPGIEIGNNSIIGSGSVVTKNVPPNEIWVGNPARFVKLVNIGK